MEEKHPFKGEIFSMGRKFPSNMVITSIHPILSLALFVTWVVAMIATVSSLCGMCSKKSFKSQHEEEKKNVRITTIMTTESTDSPPSQSQDTNNIDHTTTTTTNDDGGLSKPLPPPPAATKLEFGETIGNKKTNQPSKIDKSPSSLQNYMSKGSRRRKLSSSLSMRMSMKIKDKASDFKDKASELSHMKTKHDSESLWTKRIILGERCRLPNEVDDEVISIDDDGDDDEQYSILEQRSVTSLNRGVDSSVNEEHMLTTIKEKEKEKE